MISLYVLKRGLRYGPYSSAELQQQLDTGTFEPEHFASCDNCHNWMPISEFPEIAPRSFQVETDEGQDLLVLRYRGRVGQREMERCPEAIRRALRRLRPGFRLLADFTELHEMDASCASLVTEIMDLCNDAGVATVVRVIPDPKQDIGLQIMSLFHYGNDVLIETCASREEAGNMLKQSARLTP